MAPRTDTRTLSLPSSDDLPRTSRTYYLQGTRLDGEFGIGVSVHPEAGGTIDDLPAAVHGALSEMADDAIQVDRLRADTTEENWPIVGTMTTSPGEGCAVDVDVEWRPHYHSTEGDETA